AVLNVVKDYGFDDDAIVKAGQNNNENAVAGAVYTYTVMVENKGPSTILDGKTLYFRDIVSSGQTIQSVDFGGVNPTVGTNGRFDLQMVNDITAGATFSFDVTVFVDAAAPNTIRNTVYIWQDDPNTDVDNPDAQAETPPIDVDRDYGFDDDAIVKAGQNNNENALAGNEYTYTVTVTNQGPSVIMSGTAIHFRELPSAGQTVTGISYNGSPVSWDAEGLFQIAVANDVAVNGTFNFDVTVLVDAAAPATISNKVYVWQDAPTDIDTPEGEAETPPIDVDRDYGFDDDAIVKAGQNNNENAVAGSEYTYTVTVTNQGPSVIMSGTAIHFRELPSAGQTVTGISYNGSSVSMGADNLFQIAVANDVAVNGTFNFDVTVFVYTAAPATISNTLSLRDALPIYIDTPEGEAETPPIDVDRDYGFDD